MKLLGHKDIRMTLRYVLVTQQDLQREFHQARQNAAHLHRVPRLALPKDIPTAGLPDSVRHWRPPVTFWKCTAVSSATRKLAAICTASTNASSVFIPNCRRSIQRENEGTLAG
jgi:hypothetical protein